MGKAKTRKTRAKGARKAAPRRRLKESVEARKKRVRDIIKILRKAHPDAKQDLEFSNPLELLIALILAAQCTDERVNAVTRTLFRKYRTASDWARLPLEVLEEEIRSTGFFRNKAKAIQACCAKLLELHRGEVPTTLESLVELPGVGRKTANLIIGDAFGKPAIGVDTHVLRLAQRLELTANTDPDRVEYDLVEVVPPKNRISFSHLLQYHGRRICNARKPDCPDCPIRRLCPFPGRKG